MILNKQYQLLALSLVFSVTGLIKTQAKAATLVSYCYMDDTTKKIEGKNIHTKYPVASVSKLLTSLIAATSYSLDHKFVTQIFANPVGDGTFDVHIKGSFDPYFNRQKMHMVISRLNQAGVGSIRTLSFDENVKYIHDTDARAGFYVGKKVIRPLILKEKLTFPEPSLVEAQLKQTYVVLQGYSQTVASAKQHGIKMVTNPKFKFNKIKFVKSEDFEKEGLNSKTIRLYVTSQDLKTIIKSMNWNSNNFAANRLLEASGGLNKMSRTYSEVFKLPASEFSFVNGSGQNHDLTGQGRLYNEASCNVVVRSIRGLKAAVEHYKHNFEDVVAVMGADRGSTVAGSTYTNPATQQKVAAKTGTIGTHVTLAGMIYGKSPKFFMYNVAVNGSTADENAARRLIAQELKKLVISVGGKAIKYVSENPLKEYSENYDLNALMQVGLYVDKAPYSPFINKPNYSFIAPSDTSLMDKMEINFQKSPILKSFLQHKNRQ